MEWNATTTAATTVATVCAVYIAAMHPVCINSHTHTQHYWICTVHVLSACQSYSLYFHYDMKIWKVLNSEIHVISSCILLISYKSVRWCMCARWVSVCAKALLFSRLVWLGVHEPESFSFVWLIAKHAICVCLMCPCVSICFFSFSLLWFALIRLAECTYSERRTHFWLECMWVWRMCGSHLLYSPKCIWSRHCAAFTHHRECIYYRREKYAVQSCCFFPSLLVSSRLARWLLSKQCCMFKMHAKGNKMLLEWYEFIWFNFDTETMHYNAKTPHTRTRTYRTLVGLFHFGAHSLLDKWHTTNDMTTI